MIGLQFDFVAEQDITELLEYEFEAVGLLFI